MFERLLLQSRTSWYAVLLHKNGDVFELGTEKGIWEEIRDNNTPVGLLIQN